MQATKEVLPASMLALKETGKRKLADAKAKAREQGAQRCSILRAALTASVCDGLPEELLPWLDLDWMVSDWFTASTTSWRASVKIPGHADIRTRWVLSADQWERAPFANSAHDPGVDRWRPAWWEVVSADCTTCWHDLGCALAVAELDSPAVQELPPF